MEQRYLVDVKSEAHQRAINNDLSYIEGIVYNEIAYDIEHFGNCKLGGKELFLHISEKEFNDAIKTLTKKNMIAVVDDEVSIIYMTLDELRNDPIIGSMLATFEMIIEEKLKKI